MANTKGKIIIISGLILVTGITTAIVESHFRKKRILKIIYEKLNDKTTSEGQQALLNEEEQLLGSNAFSTTFWEGKGKVKPDANLLLPTMKAREIAKNIKSSIADAIGWEDDENAIISEFKKLKSKGQVSQVAMAYANSPLFYGDLANSVTYALTGYFDDAGAIKQLTTYINSLPN